MSCSASFTASAGFQVGSAAMQTTATSAEPKTVKIFITRNNISYAQRKLAFSGALSFHSNDYLPASVSFFQIADRVGDFA